MPFGKVAGIRDDNRCDGGARKSSATGSPRPVVVRICVEAGLLADGVPGWWAWHSLRLPANPLHRVCSGVAANITVHSCGGSRGIDRVPFLASADAEEPRKRKATHRVGAGQCPWADRGPCG